MSDGPIYLDHNATTPVDPRVVAAMMPYLTVHFGNPSSDHSYGVAPRRAVAAARAQVAALIRADPDEVVFTASGSEADLLAVRGAVLADGRPHPHVITQVTEHPAVLESCRALHRLHGGAGHGPGRIPLGVDLLTVVGHKMYAPKGIAALYVRSGVSLEPVVHGGGQENGLRGGTENTASIVALGAAAHLAAEDLAHGEPDRWAALRDDLHRQLAEALPGRVHRNGHPTACLPNTLNISVDGLLGHELLANTPEIAASTGSACHSGARSPSPVLTAMGLPPDRALAALRLSSGRWTTQSDIDEAAEALCAAARGRTR
ncbi:MAG: cysteine desulfurase [Actinomycetota bacterium]|nr:cysteine desulfurase [Actinomycetota bacterium]